MLPPLVAALLRPETYPHHPAEVTLVQTHISYVFLAGDEVYKVKKAVRFPFLDFSTLALRCHFCHEEVRLNRRLAPDVYRGVVAICGDPGGYRFAPADDRGAVEYAVHMRRLPDDRMLARLLDRNAASAAMIDAVGSHIAAFHQRADTSPEITANGDPAALAQSMEDDFAGVRPFRGDTISTNDDDAIQRFCHGVLARDENLFRGRQAEGRIRDCHGDLHAEHVCFTDGLIIFDCIEFNAAFRYRDVAAEIAFLAMDLEYHGHPELAARLVSGYADRANDPQLPRLVPFYQCHRAYVRGKVDSLKSAEAEVAPSDREQARLSARRHFALAYRYTYAYSPCLVVIAGLSGSGKSTVAAALRERTGFVHVNSDVVRKQLAGLAPTARAPAAYQAGLYAPELSARTYGAMLAEAAEHLAEGRGVILDATFQRRAHRDAARAVARECGVACLLVECRSPDEQVRRRLSERVRRGNDPSDADWQVYVEQKRRYEPVTADEDPGAVLLDTTAPLDVLTAAVERGIRDVSS